MPLLYDVVVSKQNQNLNKLLQHCASLKVIKYKNTNRLV